MNKKYTIVNTGLDSSNLCIDNFFYIVIFILAIYLVIQIVSTNYRDNFSIYKENFENNSGNNSGFTMGGSATNTTAQAAPATSTSPQNIANNSINATVATTTTTVDNQKLTIEQELQEAKTLANALKVSKETLEESMKKQARTLFLANNFYRIDDSSFNNELTFINDDFVDIRLPESDFKGKVLISTTAQWNDLLAKANSYKNLYKPGDVVIKPSNYNISKDTICYKDYETHLTNDPNFKKKYPECMVCSVNPDADYKNTKSWKNTQTNIHKVCLFNPNAPNNSTILNYNGCRNLCSLK
jgi:hypothetical protein